MPETCAAIVIAAKHGELIKVRDYSGITNTVGALRCKFEFRTNDWDNATMTAVFCKGNMATNPEIVDGAIGVLLDSIDECAVPAEVLTRDAKYFSVGVWGVTTAGFRIVSKWLVFRIEDGCYVDTTEPIEPTPTVYEQIMSALSLKAPINHEHNDIYYTKTEIDNILVGELPDIDLGGGSGLTDEQAADLAANTQARHIHNDNLSVLDKFSEDEDGELLYNGNLIGGDSSNLTDEQLSDLTANTEARHIHTNKEILDFFGINYAKTRPTFKGDATGTTNVLAFQDDITTRTGTLRQQLQEQIAKIPKFSIAVVNTLPTENISETTVYLLIDGETDGNIYTEYIYVNNAWEKLGTQSVDVKLGDYYTKAEIDNKGFITVDDLPEGGGVVVEVDPTVPEWAKQPNKPSYTASEVGALPASIKIPSTTSDLTNNSGFITKDVSDLTNYHKKSDVYTRTEIDNKKFLTEHQDLSSYAKKADVPTKTSDLENNSDFITRDETYSQAEIDNKLSLIPKFSISVVTKLPTTNISATTVYLLKDTTTNGNLYTEYIYVNDAWEMLGGQNVDLADYVKIEDIQDNINAALATAKASGEFKGDPFTYDDFTPEQLELLKGKGGKDGLSAYQIWLNNGNTGTEAEFLASLKGTDGDDFTYDDFTSEQLESLKGEDGTPATHEWNGTVLTITSASGTSSADLKGETGNSGVYIGTDVMPADCNVKINPNGGVIRVPTKLSELDNDKGFITKVDIPTNGTSECISPYYEGTDVTATTDIEQKVIDAYTSMMAEAKGNYNKIPFILQTDNHGSYPDNIYNLCAKMVNFAELSRVLTLGDTVYKTYSIAELTDFAEKMKVFPVEKMVTITGNHDASTTNGPWTAIEQAELNQFWRNYAAKMGGKNGYFVSYDDYRRVKYISVGEYDVEKGASYNMGGNLMSTEQAIFILDEMQKNDGYDIIMLGHCPFLNTVEESVTLNKATDGGGDALMKHPDNMRITPVLKNFKARTSGTYTDKSGIVHRYDFSDNTNDILLSMHGHTHPEGYYYIEDANIVYMFGSYKYGVGHPFYFGYIDRKDRYIKYWRVTDNADNVVIKVGLDGVAVDGVTLDKSAVDVAEGNTINLVASVSPLNASNQKVVWTSSDNNIATVDENGKVTGIAEGSATITVTTEEGNFTASCSVTVTARQFVNVAGVTIEPSELRIIKGGSSTLIATVIPENATNKNVIWTSSDNSKATVVDGVVTGVAEGSTTITATTEEGNFTASCVVNVASATLPAEYQAVEYIGSTGKGKGAIDTGYKPTSTTGMKVSISNVSAVSSDSNCLGCRIGGGARFVFGYVQSGDNVKFSYGYNESNTTDTLWSLSDNVNLSLNYMNDRKAIYNNEAEYALTSSIEGKEMPSIGLFYQNSENSNSINNYGQKYRIHSFEITEGSDLVRRFIPCYRKSDNVIGMFEIYTQTFFENIGTGTFEKGADV